MTANDTHSPPRRNAGRRPEAGWRKLSCSFPPSSGRRTAGFVYGMILLLAACATTPPRNVDDACAIFAEYGDWFADAKAASQRWDVPLPVLLAIIHQESAFRADARPPRTWYLGFIPGPRPSSAYGYSQALDGTWDHYIAATGNRGADRDEFDAAVDFIGWYVNETARRNGIAKNDAYNQYLAYHEGQGGFAKGTYRKKPWLLERARRVRQQADRYGAQLTRCEPRLLARQ
jgi:hypothetical protein